MRKLKLQMQMSLDGFVCGLNGELDWMIWNWDEKLQEDGWVLTNSFDTIIMAVAWRMDLLHIGKA